MSINSKLRVNKLETELNAKIHELTECEGKVLKCETIGYYNTKLDYPDSSSEASHSDDNEYLLTFDSKDPIKSA